MFTVDYSTDSSSPRPLSRRDRALVLVAIVAGTIFLLRPLIAESSVWRSNMYEIAGDNQNALKHAQRAALVEPDDAQVNYTLGMAYIQTQQSAKAVPALRKATQADPGNWGAWFALSEALASQGEYADAAQAALRAVNAGGAEPYVRRQLAAMYVKSGRSAEASAVLRSLEETSGATP